jgi:hypothetical protein
MKKLDLKKELSQFYNPPKKEVTLVDVPPLNFLMVDGQGNPNTSQAFKEAMEALYSVSYTVKFTLKKDGRGPDYTVMPLEGLWWTEGGEGFHQTNKDLWHWTVMIMQPDHITDADIEQAIQTVQTKKNPPALKKLRFERYTESLSVQIMYLGPYDEEGPTIDRLHAYAQERGYNLRGKHHEIYLSDPRRTKPERLKTILRQPVYKA